MDTPLVSVLMPAYNAEKYISASIESILGQSFSEFELIIVDDASADQTWKIMQAQAAADPRIRIFQNEKNVGISLSRNRAIEQARAPVIAWQDADDISFPERLNHEYAFLIDHPDVGIVGGFLQFFSEQGNSGLRKYYPDDARLRKNIFKYQAVSQPGAMVRKECFDTVGLFDSAFSGAEDLDMTFRIGTKYRFANLQEPVIRYRENEQSTTFTKLRTMESCTLAVRKKYAHGYGYTMSLSDKIYNALQSISINLLPAKLRIKLFNFLRNSK